MFLVSILISLVILSAFIMLCQIAVIGLAGFCVFLWLLVTKQIKPVVDKG
jgi:hypothetical protein